MNVTPMERARQLKTLKEERGTLAETASIAGMSVASVSRYLQLLELPDDIQQQVDCGELPVNQTLAALRKKSGMGGERKTSLADHHHAALTQLAHAGFVTLAQLAAYVGKSLSHTRTCLQELLAYGLVDVHRDFRPHAFFLTAKGCELQAINKPKHVMSANAIHQRLLRNQIELTMREKNPSVRFIGRTACWAMGFFSAVAEHLLAFEHNGKSRYALVLIDDYAMAPARVIHVLNRPHDENKTKVAVTGNHVMRWSDLVDTVLVYSTNPKFRDGLSAVLTGVDTPSHITLTVRDIAPLWEFV